MNKEIIAMLGVGAAVLVAIWITWRDVTFQLTDMNARLDRVEGVLIAQGKLDSQAVPARVSHQIREFRASDKVAERGRLSAGPGRPPRVGSGL